uniref:Nuclear pore complex protein NUP96 C-terminal domain-containing protein n=1 Tax=Chenopodium quinoa TaxID=63459 RepID=A0A803LHV1_CHEQI
MGRSFCVGWGPNGLLIHSGVPVSSNDDQGVLSSVITLEKVTIDRVTRDETNEVKKDVVDSLFKSPLDLHRSLDHKILEVEVGSFKLSLQKVVCDRLALSYIFRRYIELVEKQLKVPGMLPSVRMSMMHQVIVWELIKYELPQGTALPAVFHTYQHLLTKGKTLYPILINIDEGPVEETVNIAPEGRYDLAYYLMLLHACEDGKFDGLKSMFNAFASTNDPLDYHMIWHQRGILEEIGAFSYSDLHILDMAYVSQLLCLGKCRWAIHVVLHMPYCEDFPYLHSTVIREILFQYCDTWSSQEEQRQFIEELGIPSQWLHEAMAVYFQYYGDMSNALEHYIQSAKWQKAHSVFITSVVYALFLSGNSRKHNESKANATMTTLLFRITSQRLKTGTWELEFISHTFYLLRSSLQGADDDINKLDSLESKEAACREFFDCMNKSLEVLESKLPTYARAYNGSNFPLNQPKGWLAPPVFANALLMQMLPLRTYGLADVALANLWPLQMLPLRTYGLAARLGLSSPNIGMALWIHLKALGESSDSDDGAASRSRISFMPAVELLAKQGIPAKSSSN